MSHRRVAVSAVQPEGNIHGHAFDEVYQTLAFGLEHLGFEVVRLVNGVLPDTPTILFGAHLLDAGTLAALPTHTILYNLEQADPGALWLSGPLPKFMSAHEVWDFSEINVRRLAAAGIAPKILWAPVGYVPEMTRIPKVAEDIDVLFYGSANPRRLAILEGLRERNVNVFHAFGVYGTERDKLIARSKIVLNMHFYESGIFEWVRVFYLLANGKAIVSEDSRLTAFDQGIETAVRFSPYEQLIETCLTLLANDQARELLQDAIPDYLSRRKETVILQSVLGASSHDFAITGDLERS